MSTVYGVMLSRVCISGVCEENPCVDDDPCTAGVCDCLSYSASYGTCLFGPKCPSSQCVTGSCNPETGECTFANRTGSCNSVICVGRYVCIDGACVPAAAADVGAFEVQP